jgi:hypothetical protein
MRSNRFKNKLGGLILALSVLFGIGIISSSTVQAQWRRDDGWRDQNGSWRRDRDDRYRNNRNRDNRYEGSRVALNQGYQAGLTTGASDAQRRQSYNPQRSHYYKDADSGYNSYYGSRGQYRQAFREGFLRGYNEGYQRYGYNRGGVYDRGVYDRRRGIGTSWPW